jgi:hypothetical protein
MAEQPRGVDGVLVAVAGGKLEERKNSYLICEARGFSDAGRLDSGLKPKASSPNPRTVSFDFQFVILDDRIAQQLVRRVVQGLLRGGLVRAGREVNLDVFADVNAGDAGVAHLGEGGLDGFALRIKDGLFGVMMIFAFIRAWECCEKIRRRASIIFDSPRATALNLSAACAIV